MRIAIVNQFYIPDISPTAHLSASLAEGLAAAGHTVSVITSRGGYVPQSKGSGAGSDAASDGPMVYRIWTPQLGKKSIIKRCIDYASFYLLAAWRMLRLPAQDVVISLTTPPYIAWTGVMHGWLHPRTKQVLWSMDCYPDAAVRAGVLRKEGLPARLMHAMNRALFRRLDYLICLDQAMLDLLMGQYAPKRPLPTAVIPNWERLSLFPGTGTAGDGGDGRQSTAWDQSGPLGLTGKFVILYMGNAGVGHPFEAVAEAARRLKDRGVVFLFVGGGKRWPWLEQTRDSQGLTNLIMHPYVPKEVTGSIMRTADCALITLRDDMLGVMCPSKLHSYLAMSLPVIYVGPQTSNVDEAITRFGCGVSLRQGDVEGIIRYIEEATTDSGKLWAQRQMARHAFETAYCDKCTLPQFEAILDRLCGAKQARAPAVPEHV